MDSYKLIISPETISSELVSVNYSGQSVGVYSAMTSMLTGGTNGTSLLTGLTIPILFTETINDVGYFDSFDGAIMQQDVVTNFIFSATTSNPYDVYFYNTSKNYQKFLDLSNYTVDWGDGTTPQPITTLAPNFITHSYPQMRKQYEITLSQKNPWGLSKVTKKIKLPYTNISIYNPKGNAYFISNLGNWSATPVSYDYIFSGDSNNYISAQTSSNYVTTPFVVSGESVSRLQDLEQYGSVKYVQGRQIYKNRELLGEVTNINPIFTAYTIQDIDYYDYSDGSTIFFMQSSGFTTENIVAEPIVKQEVLLNMVDQPQIQTNVYVERGKNSAYERVQRMGEVDNIGDMVNYGYGFFNVEKKI
jgi:hypothetical protein